MKIQTATASTQPRAAGEKPILTISICRAGIMTATYSANKTGQTEVAGALLAGLALSQTLFHSRAPRINRTASHAKLRL